MRLPILKKKHKQLSALPVIMVFSSTLLTAPVVLADPSAKTDAYTTPASTSITFNPLRNDSADDDTYIFIRWATQPETADSGTTTFTNNSITYTPSSDFVGTTRFWYKLEDSTGKTSGVHIKVTVGDVVVTPPFPNAENDNLTTDRGTPLTISPLVNDTGDGLKITVVNDYSSQGSRQSIVGTNQIAYVPSATAEGEDTFWYQVTDSLGRKNAAKVTVAVTVGDNAGPYPTAGSDAFTVDKDSTGNVFNVFENDTGSGLTFNKVFAYSKQGGRTFNNGTSITYDAPSDFVGTDEFWYSIKDSIGRTNSAKVTITVDDPDNGGENLPPSADEDSLRSTINAAEFEIDVLANDTDPNGDTLTVLNVEPARSGSVRLVDGKVLYTPPGAVASDTFRYTITDSRGGTDSTSVTIGVRDPDDPNLNNPVVVNEFITMTPGDTVVLKVLENDSDADGDTLSLDQVTGGSQGGTTKKVPDENGDLNWIEYTSLSTATGTETFWYGVPDGRGGNGSGKVTVTFE